MLSVPGHWVWDFWIADDGERFHAFFLVASKSLGSEHRRHRAARILSATSPDLEHWTIGSQPFAVGDPESFDATATWTGSVVRGDGGLWRMFYTGSRFVADEPDYRNIESVGAAVSSDLEGWEKIPGPAVSADGRWYETFGTSSWREEAWRDPWVFADPAGSGWHMLVTARANDGAVDDRGVIGHAVSDDLITWTAQPPLSRPGAGFAHLEVPQVVEIHGSWFLLFSCGADSLSDWRHRGYSDVGTWFVPVEGPLGPFDVADARPLTTSARYSGRAIQRRGGDWVLMFFETGGDSGEFPGVIGDPVTLVSDGSELRLAP